MGTPTKTAPPSLPQPTMPTHMTFRRGAGNAALFHLPGGGENDRKHDPLLAPFCRTFLRTLPLGGTGAERETHRTAPGMKQGEL